MNADINYPDVVVKLTARDGTAFAVLGRVLSALRRAGVPKSEQDAFWREATAGDYNHLLTVCMKWVDVT